MTPPPPPLPYRADSPLFTLPLTQTNPPSPSPTPFLPLSSPHPDSRVPSITPSLPILLLPASTLHPYPHLPPLPTLPSHSPPTPHTTFPFPSGPHHALNCTRDHHQCIYNRTERTQSSRWSIVQGVRYEYSLLCLPFPLDCKSEVKSDVRGEKRRRKKGYGE